MGEQRERGKVLAAATEVESGTLDPCKSVL